MFHMLFNLYDTMYYIQQKLYCLALKNKINLTIYVISIESVVFSIMSFFFSYKEGLMNLWFLHSALLLIILLFLTYIRLIKNYIFRDYRELSVDIALGLKPDLDTITASNNVEHLTKIKQQFSFFSLILDVSTLSLF
uniref:Uncharacterized protein n=2 Tax=Gloeochaete wittrockiana TaxID=38269 RepID=A0A096Y6S8_9EUKA|nr:hypothetical protein [Gloeochaete wittrockiana]